VGPGISCRAMPRLVSVVGKLLHHMASRCYAVIEGRFRDGVNWPSIVWLSAAAVLLCPEVLWLVGLYKHLHRVRSACMEQECAAVVAAPASQPSFKLSGHTVVRHWCRR
jgi:hypothetical protein